MRDSAAGTEPQPNTVQITVTGYRCRCGHQWVPRVFTTERPRVCPKCKSANWDRAYQFRRPHGTGVRSAGRPGLR